jgi:putative ABC transport system permease protein
MLRLYTLLLNLYPARFREEYQRPMETLFRDEYREAQGPGERAWLWLRVLADLAISLPEQISRELWLDLKHSMRVYRKRPLTAVLAVAALGLAIGVSTGVFSVLNALLLRSLPFLKPEQLVELVNPVVTAGSGRAGFVRWSRHNSYLEDAATFSTSDMNVAGGRNVLRVKVAESSANLFHLLGVSTAAGRGFASDEDIFGRNAVAIISYGLWQQMFAGDPSAIGRTLHVNGSPVTVIGVAPAGFDYPQKTAIWLPTAFDFERVPKRGAFLFETIGRLKRGVNLQTANEFFKAEARQARPGEQVKLVSLQNQLAGPVRQASWVLAGMTLLVLLTACANVAQLLLSRISERQQEMAVRAALGASRARLLQQLMTEASVLTGAGALLGLLVAYWVSRLASSVAPAQLGTQNYSVMDWRVLAFAAALALVMGMAVGALPRLIATKKIRFGLLVMQAALALCLITSSLVMGRTFLKLIHANLGFRPGNVVTLNVSLQGSRYRAGSGEWSYYGEALGRLRSVPGVTSAGAVSYLPLATNMYMVFPFKLDTGQTLKQVVVNSATQGYFQAMGTGLLAGRDFASEPGVIVNAAFAESTKLGAAIVGRRLIAPWAKTPYRIVGEVATVRNAGPVGGGIAQIYFPLQGEPPPALTLVARVNGPAEEYLARCRDAVKMADASVPIYDVKTLDQRLSDALARPRFYTTATLFLAMLSVLLAAAGIFGTAAQSIAQRRQEMGIRMAIGATHGSIRNRMVRETLLPVLCGAMLGIGLSVLSGRFLERLLENAPAADGWTSAQAAGLLLVAALAAAWSATGRVLKIDPIEVIRAE